MPEYRDTNGDWQESMSTHYAIMQAIRVRIINLQLTGLQAERVAVLKQPINRGIMQVVANASFGYDGNPAMVLTPMKERMGKRRTIARDVDYPTLLTAFKSGGHDLKKDLDLHLYWREKIIEEFDDRPFLEVSGVHRVVIRPEELLPIGTFLKGFDASTAVITATACHDR